jgi:3-phosphoshikimate 1-carboxyvinyltransferase
MAFAISALRAIAPIQVDDCANVETSFPDFTGLAAGVGLQITERRAEERAEERG